MKLFSFFCSLLAASAFAVSTEQNDVFDNGSVTEKRQGRIAGGTKVNSITKFPFQVQIFRLTLYYCSGAIISESYIITLAHCIPDESDDYEEEVDEIDSETLEVKAGSKVRGKGTVIPIKQAVRHEEYNEVTYDFDIAYLRTVSPIVFTKKIQPAVLDLTHLPDTYTVTGWGETNEEFQSHVLRETQLDFLFPWDCESAHRNLYPYVKYYSDNLMCAGREGTGTCLWDDGDPVSDGTSIYGLVLLYGTCGRHIDRNWPTVITYLQSDKIRYFITNGTGVKYLEK